MNTSRNITTINLCSLACLVVVALSILPVVSVAAPTQVPPPSRIPPPPFQVPPPAARSARSPSEDLSKLSDAEIDQRIQAVGQAPGETSPQSTDQQPWSPPLIKFLTTEVLVFGIIVIIVMGVLVLNNASTGEVLRLITVPMIIVAAIFLVVTGFTKDQITPVIALLGTLAGYILGVQSQKGSTPPPAKPAAQQNKTEKPAAQ